MSLSIEYILAELSTEINGLKAKKDEPNPDNIDKNLSRIAYWTRKVKVNAPALLTMEEFNVVINTATLLGYLDLEEEEDGYDLLEKYISDLEKQMATCLKSYKNHLRKRPY